MVAAASTLAITLYRGVTDNTAGEVRDVTWSELIAMLTKHRRTAQKNRVHGWSPAVLRPICDCGDEGCPGERGHRIDANVTAINALVIDLDKKADRTPLDQATADAALAGLRGRGLRYLVHTTHSHAPPTRVSLRLVIALSRSAMRSEWERLWRGAVVDLGIATGTGRLDGSADIPSRFWYAPSCAPDAEPWFDANDGAPLDVDAILEANPQKIDPPKIRTQPIRAPRRGTLETLDGMCSWMAERYPGVESRDRRGKVTWDIECPWEGEHSSKAHRDTVVSFGADGPGFSCLHEHCRDRHWREFRKYHEPDWVPWEERPRLVESKSQTEGGVCDLPAPTLAVAGDIPLTELGNARRFALLHRELARHVFGIGWHSWDGGRWCPDRRGTAVVLAKQVVAALQSDAARAFALGASALNPDGSLSDQATAHTARAEALAKWVRASSKASAINAMLSLAESEPEIAMTAGELDADPFLLNVANGTIDLRTGELRPHRQSDLITKLAPFEYDPTATCALWEKFLERVQPSLEVRRWLQRLVGYCLTGDVREQILAFLIGMGANGKSVFVDVLLAILGDYALRAAPDLVLAKHGEAHPTEYADLDGRRLALVTEIDQGRSWAESTIKQLTGDTTIRARRMRQDFYEFPATHKLVVCANTRPSVRGTDNGIWRRMRLVPFDVTIPKDEQDKDLIPKLLKEAPGILAWCVRGCLEWQRDGLGTAKEIESATQVYREDQDVLGQWLTDACVLRTNVWTPSADLFQSYVDWCERSGHESWSRRAWHDRLIERPGIRDERRNSARGIAGVGIAAVSARLGVLP